MEVKPYFGATGGQTTMLTTFPEWLLYHTNTHCGPYKNAHHGLLFSVTDPRRLGKHTQTNTHAQEMALSGL